MSLKLGWTDWERTVLVEKSGQGDTICDCLLVGALMAGTWRWMVAVLVLMFVCLWSTTEAVGGAVSRPRPQRRPRKKPKVEPIDVTPPAVNIDMDRVRYLRGNIHVAVHLCLYMKLQVYSKT